ncbi:MAG: hypothetical protein ACRD16_12120 [Thermoanaerobaculia bacterium]
MKFSVRSVSQIVGVAVLAFAPATAISSEIVVLRGGKTLEISKPYRIQGSQAILMLKDGTIVSVSVDEIDGTATQAARSRRGAATEDSEVPQAPTPVEAARAQKSAPKAKLKVGDDDVTHPYVAAGEEGERDRGAGDARVEVMDWDQKAVGGVVTVKGNLRNSGGVAAEEITLLVQGKDDKGKTLASTSASIAAATLDAGAVTSFVATLPGAKPISSLRFVPKWSAPMTTVTSDKLNGRIENSAIPVSGAPSGPAKSEAAPAQPTYVPRPDFAPPMANAPTSPPDDNRIPYIPNLHEENPPPPPPPSS